MKKLSATQAKVLAEIRESIAFAKQFNDFHDYYVADHLKGFPVTSPHYNRVRERYEKEVEQGHAEWARKYWEDRLNNITLTSCSSATLKALAKLGYIEIINDGGKYIDTVKLIEE